MEYFKPAVQLGLTATPKRQENADTYAYFGEPVYIYSLKDGINDGYLTPFRVKQIATTLDEYQYTPDDEVVEGEIESGKRYTEDDFNKIIEIKAREAHRVKLFMDQIDQREKTLVFCATQDHALAVRDLINQTKTNSDPDYCHRVTTNDGELGNQHLRDFQDNEKSIPTLAKIRTAPDLLQDSITAATRESSKVHLNDEFQGLIRGLQKLSASDDKVDNLSTSHQLLCQIFNLFTPKLYYAEGVVQECPDSAGTGIRPLLYFLLREVYLMKHRIKPCKRPDCGQFFIPDRGNAEFCSDECSNLVRQRRLSGRKSGIRKQKSTID